MSHNDYLLKQMQHHDPFVRDLYKELDNRIAMLEQGGEEAYVERMKLADLTIPTIVTALIVLLVVFDIISNL